MRSPTATGTSPQTARTRTGLRPEDTMWHSTQMLRLLFCLSIAVWLGSIVCLSFVVAPVAHGTFPAHEARRFLRPLFPRYYRLGAICGFVALGVVLLGRAGLSQEELARLTVPVAVAMVTSLAGEWIAPKLRDLDGEEERFARLHQVAAMLNTTTLAALVLAVAGAVMR